MDAPDCDPARLANTYRQFDRINTFVSGWHGLYRRYLRPVLRQAGSDATVLDIGCGGGDVLRHLATYAAKDNLPVRFVGADPDERAIAYANDHPTPNIRYVCATVRELADAGESFDIVLSNHVLHHLTDAEITDLCHSSARLAKRLVLHSDLRRSAAAHTLFPLLGGWFRNSFILEDGLHSIRRAYIPEELQNLAPNGWQAQEAFPFRLLLANQCEV